MKSRLAAVAVAAALTAGLAGCNFTTPQATSVEYDAADGVSGTTGLVEVRNAVLVQGEGEASLAVTFVNQGPATVVMVDVDGTEEEVELDEGLTAYGFEEQQLLFPLDAEPGSTQSVTFQADGADALAVQTQVFSPESAGYESFAPAAPSSEEPPADPQPSEADETEPSLTPTPSP